MHRDVAQLGSALRSGRRGRRFKSCHPDHDARKAPQGAFFHITTKKRMTWEEKMKNEHNVLIHKDHFSRCLLFYQDLDLHVTLSRFREEAMSLQMPRSSKRHGDM